MLTPRQITKWFHARGVDGVTPAHSLRDFLDSALSAATDLQFVVPLSQFRRLMCEALCMLYLAVHKGLTLSRPLRAPQFPPEWTDFHEELWRIYLEHELPDWEQEAKQVPVAAWESDLPHWRSVLSSLFEHYIVREERLLQKANLLFDPDGELFEDDAL